MLGKTKTSDTNQTGSRCLSTHLPAFFQRISWPKRVQTVWPQWLYQPLPQLWISSSSLTGPCDRSENCATLDRISDIRQNKELVFVSFKNSFDKDISPATISSGIKQTVILCYELSDQEALTLHQVKAHDVRAFAASKAF